MGGKLSKGEQIIGSFNPSESEIVANLKASAIDMINLIDSVCPDGRRKSKAITEVETGCMFAVKSLFAG